MNQTQSIIVYRNPLEQAFWESGLIVPLFMSLVAFVLSFYVITEVLSRAFKYNIKDGDVFAVGLISFGIALFTFSHFNI